MLAQRELEAPAADIRYDDGAHQSVLEMNCRPAEKVALVARHGAFTLVLDGPVR
jgi:hypothetical protein